MIDLKVQRLAMVPGTQCNDRLWERVMPLLGDHVNPCHVAIEQCTTRTHMLDKIGDELNPSGHLLGFSMGGYLALEYALANPDRVDSLVLIASSAFGLNREEKQARDAMSTFLKTNTYSGMSTGRIRQFISSKRWQDKALVNVVKEMDKTLGGATLLNQVQETSDREDLSARLGSLTCRVLVIAAQDDQKVSSQDLQRMADMLPNAQLTVFNDCGHMVPLEQPEALAERLNQFFSGKGQ
ncbi:alpha/beta fold hydrolase [Pseudoalteromonas umbrosa]|uniref:alpha/beta fold hydrolase n=1 Tax=Pseudoalteromonas umbrosa TaxID=3048489 RepID=UPI0024C2D1AE|nr:alpha/beta hydrolase [Pseudoalteromonas sp. B95]MDK1290637.1 alpha/beta hydrolase [Pseudoalteromonas sp. B95]